ncbi:MAG: ATP-binding protein [Pseudomonadota bacterium]
MLDLGPVLKPYLPKSLFWRAFLILVVPIVLLQLVVASVFIQRHYDGVTAQMAGSIAREINYAIQRVNQAPSIEDAQATLREMSAPFNFQIGLDEGEEVSVALSRAFFDVTGSVIAETMRAEIQAPFALDLVNFPKHVEARIATDKGALRVLVPRRRMNAANPHLLLVWMAVTAVALTGVATLFLRNQIRPIHDLSRIAIAFGRGRTLPFRPGGAQEVRRAGQAFLDMRGRIERQMEQRTKMLSGVSHDLRTPLTRMRLALAVSDETPETQGIARDVDEMEHMLEAFLSFARGEEGEVPEPVSALELAEDVAADTRRHGHEITLFSQVETPERREITVRRAAMKRCLTNLINNATSYGERVSLTTRLTKRYAEFLVEDDGPGIPEEKREDVLRPFTRLDESRNQDVASGVGLGLSIAMDIVRAHGGSLSLDESKRLGGLRVSVILPR